MRQILLNGKRYQIQGDITKRAISPWMAKVSSGGKEYSDFSQASLEEYVDFRNGIGKKRGQGSDARVDWSEGIDFTIEGQGVLGPKINIADYDIWEDTHTYSLLNFVIPSTADGQCYECTTAGTSGETEPTWDTTPGNTTADGTVVWTCRNYLAPIKIIDFQGNTYVMENSRILKWDGTNLDCVDKSLANPLDAIVVTDDTDEYLVVSSAVAAVYTINGTTWIPLLLVKTPNNTTGSHGSWVDPNNAIDDDTATFASYTIDGGGWSEYIKLNITQGVNCSSIRYYASRSSAHITKISVDVYYNDEYHNIYENTVTVGSWVTLPISGGPFIVSSAEIKFYCDDAEATVARLHEFDFLPYDYGYMADYANRLYFITTDGKTVTYSDTKDIDAYGAYFTLTGNYGIVYDLFEGKLLSDGTPTLYMNATEGVYSIDTTNQIAYKQEVEYPPLQYAGHKALYWNGNVWVATGYGILKITPSMATHIGPNLEDGLPAGYQGYVYDMVPVNNWLVYCVNGGSTDKSSIFKRNATYGGSLQIYTTSAADKAITCLHHSPSSIYLNGRLWFGEGTDIKYMMFPDTTSNVKQIATYEYVNDSGYGKFPILRNLAVIPKVALGIGAITKSCVGLTSEYIEVFHGLNGANPTESLGTFTSSPKPTPLLFNSGLGTEFYTIQFAIKLYRGDTATKSPELESLLFYYLPRPNTISAWTFNVQCIEDDAEEIISEFEAIRDTKTLVVFNPTGDEKKTAFDYNVALTTMPMRFYVENQQTREGVIQVTVEEIFNG